MYKCYYICWNEINTTEEQMRSKCQWLRTAQIGPTRKLFGEGAYPAWPTDKPFPLTPLEAWYVMQGWEVKPAAGLTFDQFNELPGKIEGGDGWVCLWQS